jgi:uncharacterized protein YecA (UPF0149 family)
MVRLFVQGEVFAFVTIIQLSPAITGLINAIQDVQAEFPDLPSIQTMEGVMLAAQTVSQELDPVDWAPLLVPGGVHDVRWRTLDMRRYLKLLEKLGRSVARHLGESTDNEWEPFSMALGLDMTPFLEAYLEVFRRWDVENIATLEQVVGCHGGDLAAPMTVSATALWAVNKEFEVKRQSFSAACVRIPGKAPKLLSGPNDPCPCLSGKKGKYCHLR